MTPRPMFDCGHIRDTAGPCWRCRHPAADSDVWADPEDTQPSLSIEQVRRALEAERHDATALAEIDKNAPAVRYPLPPDRATASAWVLARYLVRLLVWRWRARWERKSERAKPPTTRPSK